MEEEECRQTGRGVKRGEIICNNQRSGGIPAPKQPLACLWKGRMFLPGGHCVSPRQQGRERLAGQARALKPRPWGGGHKVRAAGHTVRARPRRPSRGDDADGAGARERAQSGSCGACLSLSLSLSLVRGGARAAAGDGCCRAGQGEMPAASGGGACSISQRRQPAGLVPCRVLGPVVPCALLGYALLGPVPC